MTKHYTILIINSRASCYRSRYRIASCVAERAARATGHMFRLFPAAPGRFPEALLFLQAYTRAFGSTSSCNLVIAGDSCKGDRNISGNISLITPEGWFAFLPQNVSGWHRVTSPLADRVNAEMYLHTLGWKWMQQSKTKLAYFRLFTSHTTPRRICERGLRGARHISSHRQWSFVSQLFHCDFVYNVHQHTKVKVILWNENEKIYLCHKMKTNVFLRG